MSALTFSVSKGPPTLVLSADLIKVWCHLLWVIAKGVKEDRS